MRLWQLAITAIATMTTHVAASAEPMTPAGLDGGADTGGVSRADVQPGSLLVGSDRLVTASAPAASPDKKAKLRRIGSMMDFYPTEDGEGLHFSAGLHNYGKKFRGAGFNPFGASKPTALIYTPAVASTLPVHMDVKRHSPAMSVGWTHSVDRHAVIGFEAGTTFDHGGGHNMGLTPTAAWSRVDPVAQASFALRF